jgi:hypothetical protein
MPAFDVSDDAGDAYASYLSIRPVYPRKEKAMPAFDASAEGAAAFDAYLGIRPVYPRKEKEMPAFHITADAADAYASYQSIWPQYPRKEKEMPTFDVSDVIAPAFAGYLEMEEEFKRQAVFDGMAVTTVTNDIIPEPMERRISDLGAAEIGRTGNYAETGGSLSDPPIRVKGNDDFNQEGAQVLPEKREGRAARFVFRNGRIQKVVDKVEITSTDIRMQSTVSEEPAPVERIAPAKPVQAAPLKLEEPVEEEVAALPEAQDVIYLPEAKTVISLPEAQDVIYLPEAQDVIALPAAKVEEPAPVEETAEPKIVITMPAAEMVAKDKEGVSFSFGRSNYSYESVRFSF